MTNRPLVDRKFGKKSQVEHGIACVNLRILACQNWALCQRTAPIGLSLDGSNCNRVLKESFKDILPDLDAGLHMC